MRVVSYVPSGGSTPGTDQDQQRKKSLDSVLRNIPEPGVPYPSS